jgi:hypothetical protein
MMFWRWYRLHPLVDMADVRQYKFVRLLGMGGFAEVYEYVGTDLYF